jgi:hypothetical protein
VIDLKLNENYDLDMVDGDLVLVTDGDEVAQSAGIRLLFIQAEWFFNYTLGIPWLDNMFTTATSYEQKSKILKDTIIGTQGINQILYFIFGIDPVLHEAQIEFAADTQYGVVSLKVGS